MSQNKSCLYSVSKSIDISPSDNKLYSQDKFKHMLKNINKPKSNLKLFSHLKNLSNNKFFAKNQYTIGRKKNIRDKKSHSYVKSFRQMSKNKKHSTKPFKIISTMKSSNGFNFQEINDKSFLSIKNNIKKSNGQRYIIIYCAIKLLVSL